jgi:hypothetical protein
MGQELLAQQQQHHKLLSGTPVAKQSPAAGWLPGCLMGPQLLAQHRLAVLRCWTVQCHQMMWLLGAPVAKLCPAVAPQPQQHRLGHHQQQQQQLQQPHALQQLHSSALHCRCTAMAYCPGLQLQAQPASPAAAAGEWNQVLVKAAGL